MAMNKKELIDAIVKKRGRKSHGVWTIGITNDPKRRKKEHENDGKDITNWKDWLADSSKTAREVESYFVEKGMKGGTREPVETPTYVYVF
jgi:hypothetical protein